MCTDEAPLMATPLAVLTEVVGTVVVVVGVPALVGGGTGLSVVLVEQPPAVVHPGSVKTPVFKM